MITIFTMYLLLFERQSNRDRQEVGELRVAEKEGKRNIDLLSTVLFSKYPQQPQVS